MAFLFDHKVALQLIFFLGFDKLSRNMHELHILMDKLHI